MDKLQGEHGVDLSYTWVKTALQTAGLVAKSRKRGKHHKKRPRRPLPGMMLHVDGSTHRWLAGPAQQDMVAVLDDATTQVYYAQLVEQESTVTVMRAIREVIERKGLFCSLYSDRGSHFVHTAKAGESLDPRHKTQLGRALAQLGIDLIPANSPQARGRCERFFGTWQGRLPQELRWRKIDKLEGANQFLRDHWIGWHNLNQTVAAAQRGSAFLPYRGRELELIFSLQHERVVNQDNTVAFDKLSLQIEPQTFRYTLAGCRVLVCQHLDATISLHYGPHQLGRYNSVGELIAPGKKQRHKGKAA